MTEYRKGWLSLWMPLEKQNEVQGFFVCVCVCVCVLDLGAVLIMNAIYHTTKSRRTKSWPWKGHVFESQILSVFFRTFCFASVQRKVIAWSSF